MFVCSGNFLFMKGRCLIMEGSRYLKSQKWKYVLMYRKVTCEHAADDALVCSDKMSVY